MAIIFPLTPPSAPGPVEFVWRPETLTPGSSSGFTYQEFVNAWPGQRRSFKAKLPKMDETLSRVWFTFIHSLNGTEGTFFATDPLAYYFRGTIGDNYEGATVYGGAAAGAGELTIEGLPSEGVSVFVAGDWISIGDRLYQVLGTVNANIGGRATIEVFPKPIVAIPGDAEVRCGSTSRGIFRLVEWPEMKIDVEHALLALSFEAIEVLPSA